MDTVIRQERGGGLGWVQFTAGAGISPPRQHAHSIEETGSIIIQMGFLDHVQHTLTTRGAKQG